MPALGRGEVWADVVAAIARDEAKRQAECKEVPVSLHEPVGDVRKVADPEHAPSVGDGLEELGDAPNELPDAPKLGASEEDDVPTDEELAKLGKELDADDFAEALSDAVADRLVVEAYTDVLSGILTREPNPPSRRGFRRLGRRPR